MNSKEVPAGPPVASGNWPSGFGAASRFFTTYAKAIWVQFLHVYERLRGLEAADRLRNLDKAGIIRLVSTALSGVCVLAVLTGRGPAFACNLAGFVYPLYQSCKALTTAGSSDDCLWLSYWVVYGFINLLESVFGGFLLNYVPFYHTSKLAFLFWCFLPQTQGSSFLFTRYILPFMVEYGDEIDQHARRASIDMVSHATGVVAEVIRAGSQAIVNQNINVLPSVMDNTAVSKAINTSLSVVPSPSSSPTSSSSSSNSTSLSIPFSAASS